MGESEIEGNDPLWYYLLKEAAAKGAASKRKHKGKGNGGGRQLGPVGARLVAEVFIGLLWADPTSYYAINPGWEPDPALGGAKFRLREFLEWARVPITKEDWKNARRPR
jgi:hypothetical protein